jgi:hypothetical protein
VIPDPAQVPTVSVGTAAHWYGLGRSAAYEAAGRGEIPTIKIGRRLVVPVAAVRRQLGLDVEVSPAPAEPARDEAPAAETGAIVSTLSRGCEEVRRGER